MKKRNFIIGIGLLLIIGIGVVLFFNREDVDQYTEIGRPPKIDPDYINTVITPNIAPMNFIIKEPGTRYYVQISSTNGKEIRISSNNGKIIIPKRKWTKLLNANRGEEIYYLIYIKDKGKWYRYQKFFNRIAKEDIDSHLVYRLIDPMFVQSKVMGIYQRNLTNFHEEAILHTRALNACYNCHSFHNKKPDNMKVFVDALDYARHHPVNGIYWFAVGDVFWNNVLDNLRVGGMDVEKIVKHTAPRMQEKLDEFWEDLQN